MTNLQRLTGKIFGETATATGDDPQIGQFGSALNGTYVGTTDVATIQSLPAWSNGFIDSVTPNEQFPPLPEMTGFGKVLSYQTAYTLQKGIPEWDPGTTYYTGDFCKGVGEGKLYVSKIDLNINNDLTDTNSWEEFSSGNGYEVGDIIIRNTPTNDAGKHLLDGALIQYGSYQAFVDYIADLYDELLLQAQTVYNVNIVGTLTNTDGVLSGFDASNYAVIPKTFNPSPNTWEFNQRIKFSSMSRVQTFFGETTDQTGFAMNCEPTGVLTIYIGNSGWNIANSVSSSLTVSTDTWYDIKVSFNGTQYLVDVSTDNGSTWTNYITINSSASISASERRLGNHIGNAYYVLGTIDLNYCYININNSRWWSGTEQIIPGFCTEEQWQTAVTTYGVCGKFVYDSVNNTVRLPKITGIIEGTTDVTALGDLVEAGLPNITGSMYAAISGGSNIGAIFKDGSGAISTTTSGTITGVQTGTSYARAVVSINASNSNSIYGNSTTVQPQAIKVLYYIVIATSTKTDIQVDIDEIATDLNGKVDVDLTNVNNSGTSKGAGWGMPSDTSISLTVGASGITYTAPANGKFVAYVDKSNANNVQVVCELYNQVNNDRFLLYFPPSGSNWVRGSGGINVKKGDTVIFSYSNSTPSLYFIYAQGSESEAS